MTLLLPLLLLLTPPKCLAVSKRYGQDVPVTVERTETGDVKVTVTYRKGLTPIDVVSIYCVDE